MRANKAIKNSAPAANMMESAPLFSDAEMFARTLSLGNQTYFVLDMLNDELIWPPETYRLWGLDPEKFDAVPRDHVVSSIYPQDRVQIESQFENPDIDELHYEFRITLPDGTERHIRSNAIRDRDHSGQAVRIFGLLRDITDEQNSVFQGSCPLLDDFWIWLFNRPGLEYGKSISKPMRSRATIKS